ncbi:MAG: hypothetical protein WDA07_13290 [Leucobacter sp.]
MGRRRSRKQERRQAVRRDRDLDLLAEPTFEELLALELEQTEDWDLPVDHPFREAAALAPAQVCGRCREFVEDGDAGRGTCLHPGSGILAPWTDTPACDFFESQRRR